MKALGTWLRTKPTGQGQQRVRTRGEQKGRYMIVFAGIILAVGACLSAEVLWFLKGCVTRPGTVVDNRKSVVNLRGKNTDIFHVVVEFSDDAGVRYELEHGENLREEVLLGTSFPVHYAAGHVERARLGGNYLWTWPLGCIAFAVIIGGFGAFLIYFSRFLVWVGVPMRTY